MMFKLGSLHFIFLKLPDRIRAAIVVSLVLLVSLADILIPHYISFTGFYVLVIFLSIWYFHNRVIFAFVFSISLLGRLYVAYLETPQGSPFWHFFLSFLSILISFGVVAKLTTGLKQIFIQLQEQSDTDELTGLRNRRSFLSMARFELSRMGRVKFPLTVAMLDLDNFKLLNDAQGHAAGDALLVSLSRYIHSSLRDIDIVARLGGDEFGMLLPSTTLEEGGVIIHRLHANLQPLLHSFQSDLGCSIGAINITPEQNLDISELLEKADALMYKVKQYGKNSVMLDQLS